MIVFLQKLPIIMSDFMAVVIYSQGIRQFHSLICTEAAVIEKC